VARLWAPSPDGLPKYLCARGSWRGQSIYNHAALLEQTDDPAIVVEGVIDAISVWPCGVALLGLSGGTRDGAGRVASRGMPTVEQVDALSLARRPLAVVLDGDAWEEGEATALQLRLLGARAGYVRLPPRTDPDEVPASWLLEEARRCWA
jgi:hypothetical protein